ncbi:MAG: hypothetical protein LKJ90_07065 [Faecalibacterium sp.]|jgi:hypothetical protein|nr:hypothetical protein [Faecalibacterium sp.]
MKFRNKNTGAILEPKDADVEAMLKTSTEYSSVTESTKASLEKVPERVPEKTDKKE